MTFQLCARMNLLDVTYPFSCKGVLILEAYSNSRFTFHPFSVAAFEVRLKSQRRRQRLWRKWMICAMMRINTSGQSREFFKAYILRVWIAPTLSKSANGAVKRTDIEIHWPILCVFLLFPLLAGERMASEGDCALFSLGRGPSLVKGLPFLLSFARVHHEMASFQMLTLYKFHAINHFCKLRFSTQNPFNATLNLNQNKDFDI